MALRDYEFRSATQSEMEDFQGLLKYVFAETSVPSEKADEDPTKPEQTTCAYYNGALVASSAGFPFKMRMNGKGIIVDGVTAVGTRPDHRRRGLVRELITRRLHQAYESEQPAAILWASMGAIYQRFGYGLASTFLQYKFDPRFTNFEFGGAPKGRVELIEKKVALPTLKKLYRQFIEDKTLMLHRDDIMWKGLLGSEKKVVHCAVHYDENGKPNGYLVFRTSFDEQRFPDGDFQRMNVLDYFWQDMDAYRGLWEFIRSHDLVRKVKMDIPMDDPAWNMMLEPRELNPTVLDGVYLRVVDVKRMLEGRTYALRDDVSLEILEDVECPWNVGKYLLTTEDGEPKVTMHRGKCDFAVSMHGLASLVSGHQTLTHLDRIGRASVENTRKLPLIDALFATRHAPYCADGF